MHDAPLTDSNFLLYSAKYYNNHQCIDEAEFYEDLNRFKYLKRLFNRYQTDGELKERLILNHIIILYNVFGIPAATRMLFFKLEPKHWPLLKPFLVHIGCMPDIITGIGEKNKTIINSDIPLNVGIVQTLRKI